MIYIILNISARRQKEKEDQMEEDLNKQKKFKNDEDEIEYYGHILKFNVLNLVSPHSGLVSPHTGLINPQIAAKRHYAEEYLKDRLMDSRKATIRKIMPIIHYGHIKYLLLLVVITFVDQILEGSSSFPSILGFRK